MDDFSKFFLFVILAMAVLVMLGNKERPTARTPLEGDNDVTTSESEPDMISRGPGFANSPSNNTTPPLSLMMPLTGVQPLGNA